MIVRILMTLVVAALFLEASASYALSIDFETYSVYPPPVVGDGGRVTVAGRIENFSGTEISAFSLSVSGFDANGNGLEDDGLLYERGSVSSAVFVTRFEEAAQGYDLFGGIENDLTEPGRRGSPSSGATPAEELHLSVFEGVSATPAVGDGTFDPGPDGIFIQDGNHHFYLSFLVSGSLVSDRSILLTLDALALDAQGDPIPVPSNSIEIRIPAIPEPATGLLMGLGLMALSRRSG